MNKTTVIAIATVLVMAGCGGGGSSASVTSPTTVSGNAVKGIIMQAKVLVCRIINGVPEANSSCASTTTGNDGAYNVTFNDGYTGPVMVQVMPNTTGTPSTMIDETTGLPIPYNMTMRAVVSAVSATTTAYVTPFSEMAAASAVGAGKMDAKTISQAITAVQTLLSPLGVDLSVMPIVDLKNSSSNAPMLASQANMVTQLGKVVMAAQNSSLLTNASGVPCNTLTDTSAQIACVVAAMADPTQLANMLTAINAQAPTNISMPILQANGTITMSPINMSSPITMQSNMQTALQNAGMSLSAVAGTATTMVGGMRR
jgi:hypothetical protein